MLLPNKLFSYNESIISKFPIALEVLEQGPFSVVDLYKKINKSLTGIGEYMDLLDALYALNKIQYDDERGVLIYV